MGYLSKFWSLTRREKQLFCEAFSLLLLSHLSVKMIAFRHIYSFLGAHWNDHPTGTLERADDIRLVNLSLSRAASPLPWKSLCLSRSIAAFIMLRRRGVPAVIFAGVKFEDSSLLAHAWVHAGRGVPDRKPEKAAFTALMTIGQEPVDR
jgi:Transglutaminase-like superfamily